MPSSNVGSLGQSRFTLRLRQCVTSLGPLLSITSSGLTTGYSAVLLPQLKVSSHDSNHTNSWSVWSDPHDITVSTIDEESWIAASAVLPMAPGCLIAGALMQRLGRRMSVIWTCPVFLAGWLIVGLAGSIPWMILGRVVCGLCTGILGPLVPVYVSETSDSQLRGILLGSICVSLSIGILMAHILGTWLHWRLTAYLCGLTPILCGILCFLGQESPTWLLAKGRREEARSSWFYLRGQDANDELAALENSRLINNSEQKDEKHSTRKSPWKMYVRGQFVKPLLVTCLFFMTCQFSGVNVVTYYSVELLQDVSGPENGYLGCLVIDVIRLFFSFLACILIRRWDRRTLAIFSGLGTALTLLTLSAFLFFDIGKPWSAAILLFLYTAVVTLGLVPLPWMMCGEIFSRKYRGLGSGLTSAYTFLCFFTVVKTGPAMMESLQPYGTFTVYGVMVLTGTFILYLTLPETKDKTMEDIESLFNKKPPVAFAIQEEPFLECDLKKEKYFP